MHLGVALSSLQENFHTLEAMVSGEAFSQTLRAASCSIYQQTKGNAKERK